MSFEVIVWLLILFFFFLSRILGRGKQQQRPPGQETPAPSPQERQRDTSLEDALREIREALGEPARKPEPPPRPAEPVATRPRPTTPQPADREVHQRGDGGFHDTVLVDRSKQQSQRRPEPQRPRTPAQQQPRPQQARPQQSRPAAQRPPQPPTPLRPTTQPGHRSEPTLGETPVIDEIMDAYDRDPNAERRGLQRSDISPILENRRELKKAMKLQEILGPCRANRPYRGGEHLH